MVVGAILTQNTSWLNVEQALANLIETRLLSLDRLLSVSNAVLAQKIRSSGYFNQKARKLKFVARFLKKHSWPQLLAMDGAVLRELLLDIWGIGPETADSILLYALNKPFFVIDAYTKRLLIRLGLANSSSGYSEMQKLFEKRVACDVKLYQEYHALIVQHAKTVCKKKPLCSQCVLAAQCKAALGSLLS